MHSYSTIEEFTKTVNKARREHKDKWFFIKLEYNGSLITMKIYNTWIQIFDYNGSNYPSLMQLSVKDFNQHIRETLSYEQ